jgi:hypothetical protein
MVAPPRQESDTRRKAEDQNFSPKFKAQATPEVPSGVKSQADSARQQKLKPELVARWNDTALAGSRLSSR